MRTHIIAFVAAIGAFAATCPAAFSQDSKTIDAGEAVYNTYCETCHGAKLVNTGQSTYDLRRLRAEERPRFETSVLNGKGNMPPWKGVIDPEQLEALWAFIRANTNAK